MGSIPRVFIGCSTEALRCAHALQQNLEHHAHAEVWTHGAFRPSHYPVDELLLKASEVEYAILVLHPDDSVVSRGARLPAARDNVVLELGIFLGKLGRERTFVVQPRGAGLRIPSDLHGFGITEYDPSHPNLRAALGPAAAEIAALLRPSGNGAHGVRRMGQFEEFMPRFTELFRESTSLTAYFIHSRRWREMTNAAHRSFLARGRKQRSAVILPDLRNAALITTIAGQFLDGAMMPVLVADAYSYYRALAKDFPGQVAVYASSCPPTYSFYAFDAATVVALYPTVPARRSVPTLELATELKFGQFVKDDIEELISTPSLSVKDIDTQIAAGKALIANGQEVQQQMDGSV